MRRLVMPKSLTIFALTAGAAALSVLGATAAGAESGAPAPAPAAAAAPVAGSTAGDQQSATDPQMATDPQAASSQSAAAPQAAAAPAATSVNGRVVSAVPLRIRAQPTMNSASLGSYAPGTIVHLKCKVNGQTVDGNPRWYKLSDRTGWLAARYVVNLGNVPWC